MKTTIYIYGNLDFFGKTAAAKRMMYYAKALANEENKVYLINCCRTPISSENFKEIAPRIYGHNCQAPTASLLGSLSFLRRLYAFSASQSSTASFIIYPQAYFFLEFWTVAYMIFLKGCRVYYELNEVKKHYVFLYKSNPDSKLKALIKTAVHRVLFVLMDSMMRFYAGLICISTNIETYGARYNPNVLRIPILTNPQLEIDESPTVFAHAESFNIGFSGSIVPDKENLFEFINVINQAAKNGYKIAFNLCGTVTEKNLQRMADHCLEKDVLHYYGNLDDRGLSNFLRQQDVLVLPRGYTLQNTYGFSTKLSDYLNHQKVVLVTDISDNALFIKDGVNGFIVPPNDAEMMYAKLTYIIENFKDVEGPIIANALATSKKSFDYRLYSEALLAFVEPKRSIGEATD